MKKEIIEVNGKKVVVTFDDSKYATGQDAYDKTQEYLKLLKTKQKEFDEIITVNNETITGLTTATDKAAEKRDEGIEAARIIYEQTTNELNKVFESVKADNTAEIELIKIMQRKKSDDFAKWQQLNFHGYDTIESYIPGGPINLNEIDIDSLTDEQIEKLKKRIKS